MKLFSKTALLAAGVATLVSTTPAMARGYDRGHDRGGISAGEVIAGALIIGGIAAVASAASSNDRGRDYDRGYDRGGDYGRSDYGQGSRYAVDQCVRAAQRDASRYGRARVTDVTGIDRVRGGYEIRGRLVVEQRNYDRRGYGNQWDRYGYNHDRYNDGYNKAGFSCVTRYDRIEDLRFRGLQG
jgi:hypothetical protein